MIKCCICKNNICKDETEWKNSGGISIQTGKRLEVFHNFCHNCAKQVAEEVLDEF